MASEEEKKRRQAAAAATEAGESVHESLRALGETYQKPSAYTGNRKLYDSPRAKVSAKSEAFKGGEVHDPYTEKQLVLRKQDAKVQYGEHWQEHLAEADHTIPIEHVHETYKDDAWVTNENLRDAANSDENIRVTSRKVNNAKRSRTNEELVDDAAYLEDKGIRIDEKGKARARSDSKKAREHIDEKIRRDKVQNVAGAFHRAGTQTAIQAGGVTAALSTMDNMAAVIRGDKTPTEALKDIAADTGGAAVSGYVIGGGVSVVAHTLSTSSSPFVQNLVKSNVPGKVVTAVMATGKTLKKYASGEITTEECILELGASGVSTVTTGYTAAVGQALIPIPFVGAAVGAMFGTVVSGALYHSFKESMDRANLAREEYERVRAAADVAIARMNAEREEFEAAVAELFSWRSSEVDAGFAQLERASQNADIDGMLAGLSQIAGAYGKDIEYHSFDEFDAMMSDDSRPFEL